MGRGSGAPPSRSAGSALAAVVRGGACRALAILSGAVAPLAAQAQTPPVERNIPALPLSPRTEVPAPAAPTVVNDDRVLAPRLVAIVALGPTAPARTATTALGLDLSGAARLDRRGVRAMLARFLGRPVTRRLIGEVEAAIVAAYRRQGFPFVAVSVPEQEIGGGMLQLRVVEFRLGKVAVRPEGERDAVRPGLSLAPGDPISARALTSDIDWLDRFGYRAVTPSFHPGAALGDADLDLTVTPLRAWHLFAGYANSGSTATGLDRYFIGGTVGGRLLTDILVSAQVTGSGDFWLAGDQLLRVGGHPRYESVAVQALIATGRRQALSLTASAVESNQPAADFGVRSRIVEGVAKYDVALANVIPGAPGEIAVGVEASRQTRTLLFGDVPVLDQSIDVVQGVAGWTTGWRGHRTSGSIDLAVHVSPGGITPGNDGDRFAAFSNGRLASARYAYATLTLAGVIALPAGCSLSTRIDAQYAGRPLPTSQQMIVGGANAVRGYTIDDGAFDDAIVARGELHGPIIGAGKGADAVAVSPRLFVDIGHARNDDRSDGAPRAAAGLLSLGIGSDVQVTSKVRLTLDASRAMTDAARTKAGDARLDARLVFTL